MAFLEGCKHELEVSIPVEVVETETKTAAERIREKAHLKGFRAGKAPMSMIVKGYGGEIRQKVLETLVPKYLDARVEEENLRIVGTPDISDVHFHDGQPVRFKATFEVFPDIQLSEYKGVEVPYKEPEVSDEDLAKRLDEVRESKATFVNEEPRALANGDYAVVSLESIAGTDEGIRSDEVQVLIGGPETMAGFNENLVGASIGDEKEFDVTYPDDYGRETLAGKTVRFRVNVKGLRRRELPELNDEFAQDLGDFRTVDELKEAVRKSIFAQREQEAHAAAKDKIVEKLVDANEFPVPQVFVDRQIQNRVENRLRSLSEQGIDPRSFNLDWDKVREAQKDAALREVKASLVLGKVAEKEAIVATQADVDQELDRIARQEKEPIASLRKKLSADGTLGRIASHIQTEKTLNFLFEQSTKVAFPDPPPAAELPAAE